MMVRDALGGVVPAGRHEKKWYDECLDGSMPSWLRVAQDAGGAEINPSGGTLVWSAFGGTGSAFDVGRGGVRADSVTQFGVETAFAFDLSQVWVKRISLTLHNFRIYIPTTSQSIAASVGITNAAGTAGVNFYVDGTEPENGDWPRLSGYTSAGEGTPVDVRTPFGHITGGGNDFRIGGNNRDFTLMIDRDDKYVSVLMGDQDIFTRKIDFDLGVVRPRILVGQPAGQTDVRTLLWTGMTVAYETNGQ